VLLRHDVCVKGPVYPGGAATSDRRSISRHLAFLAADTWVTTKPMRSASRRRSAHVSRTESGSPRSRRARGQAAAPRAAATSKMSSTADSTAASFRSFPLQIPRTTDGTGIAEGDQQQDDPQDDEREDPVQRLDSPEIHQEDFHQTDEEERKAGKPQRAVADSESNRQEEEAFDRPGQVRRLPSIS